MKYDVIIYNVETRKIDSVPGVDMNLDSGFYNANKRLETVLGRINEQYDAEIVESGKYKEGDIFPP